MSKASREIIKHYKKKCARKKSIKFRQVRVNEIEMISLAFYYSRARQQTKKRQLIDHQLSFSFSCAQDKTRTCTNVIVHYPLKVACLPISPSGLKYLCAAEIEVQSLNFKGKTISRDHPRAVCLPSTNLKLTTNLNEPKTSCAKIRHQYLISKQINKII